MTLSPVFILQSLYFHSLKFCLTNCNFKLCLDTFSSANEVDKFYKFVFFLGVKNADEAELRQVASEPVDLNVYNVNDFPLLSKLVTRLVHILCRRIEDRGISKRSPHICLPTDCLSVCSNWMYSHLKWKICHLKVGFVVFLGMEPAPTTQPGLSFPSPTDLRFSQLGSRQVKLHWTNTAQPVQQYRVVYHSAESQSPQEVRTTLLHLGMHDI